MRKQIKRNWLIIVITIVFILIIKLFAPAPDAPGEPDQTPTGSPRLSELLSAGDQEGYAMALQPREFNFPEDHGPHRQYRNEWWYVTGNLQADSGARFGYELTIFRFALRPEDNQEENAVSAWRTNQVYIGHFAITDVDNETFHVAQRYSRGAVNLAGAETHPFRVWLEDWSIAAKETAGESAHSFPWHLVANDDDLELRLDLESLKPPILHGTDGLSQKSYEAGNASYYYSMTRLQTKGRLRIGTNAFDVSGFSWLDREWGSSALSREQEGWDWFSVQLSDDSELMFYQLRRIDGRSDMHSAGTFVAADGSAVPLTKEAVTISAVDTWESPEGGIYPMGWKIAVPSMDLKLTLDPLLDAQELTTTVRYWEGAVGVSGERAGTPISGSGYVELTGYAAN